MKKIFPLLALLIGLNSCLSKKEATNEARNAEGNTAQSNQQTSEANRNDSTGAKKIEVRTSEARSLKRPSDASLQRTPDKYIPEPKK